MSLKYFHDFSKKTDDFFKKDQYDLGRVVKVESKCGSTKLTGELNHTGAPTSKFTAALKPSFGKVEVTEDMRKGLKLKIEADSFYKGWDLKSAHTVSKVETELKYKPKGSFWCTRLMSIYEPNSKGKRVCRGRASIALVDDNMKLAVGAQGEVVDEGPAGKMTAPNLQPSEYSMGFRYSPSDRDDFSLIYTPDKDAGGSRFQFSALRECSDNCTIAVRAEGKADLRRTERPPVIAFGGEFKTKGGKFQGFLNNNAEFGLSYKVDLNDRAELKIGYGSFFDKDAAQNVSSVGYKLTFE